MASALTASKERPKPFWHQVISDIKWAYAAGRSVSTLNRLWQKQFKIEDALKAFGGF